MIRNILYASDLGAYSAYSLAYVEQLAKQCQAKITLLHVVPPIGPLSSAMIQSHCSNEATRKALLASSTIEGVLKTIREQAYEGLLQDEFGLDFSRYLVDIVVKRGSPAQVILDFANNNPIDMVVIGSCSQPSDVHPMLGSVAHKVLQLSKVPVFMVPLYISTESQSIGIKP